MGFSRSQSWVLTLLAFVGVGAWGCDGCGGCGEASIAELVTADGDVTRDHAASVQTWEGAAIGATFTLGDGVKTGGGGTARLTLAGGGGIELVENTVVRFLANAPNAPERNRVSVEMGSANITAGESGLGIVGTFGEAELLSGGVMSVSAVEGELTLAVEIGSARIERADGEVVDLGVGEELTFDLEMGEAVIEEVDAGPPAPADAGPTEEPDGGPPPAVEVAVTIRGRVDVENAAGGWNRLDRRTSSVPSGSHLRVSRGGRVSVTRDAETARSTGPAEMVVAPPSGALVSLSAGRGFADASTTDVVVDVPGGSFVTRGGGNGTQSSVAVTGGNAAVSTRRGSVELRGSSETYVLRDADSGTIRADGALDVTDRAPARAHVALPAGASATIHDPTGTVAVQIRFEGACAGEGSVEVARGSSFRRPAARSFGTGHANVLLSPGSHRYRVRCSSAGTPESGVAASGTISVRRDSGSQALPRRPSRNTVDADGRRYTILYQNILPIMTFRWPNAPSGSSYTLHVGSDQYAASGSTHTLEAGQVTEGTHQVFFEAGTNRSQTTTLRVGYDNATSAAYIREPSSSAHVSGTVRVSGVCVDGCTVSAGGTDLPLDAGDRFSGDATVPTDLDALAIRIVHPRTGIHYYLRRASR